MLLSIQFTLNFEFKEGLLGLGTVSRVTSASSTHSSPSQHVVPLVHASERQIDRNPVSFMVASWLSLLTILASWLMIPEDNPYAPSTYHIITED